MPQARPLFLGVTRQISSKIDSGELSPGERLPSERWFEEELGVSRTTVRRAIRELVGTGRLRTMGRAVYVAEAADADASANPLVSLTELARARGLRSSARVLASALRPASLDEAEAFQIAPGAEVFELRRLRLLDEVAVALDHNRLPLRFLPQALSIDFRVASLYASLEEAGNVLLRAELRIEARGASEEEAELLGLDAGAPMLSTTEHLKGRDGRSITIGCTVYRPDRYRFLATYTRNPASRRPASGA
jgi:GntR family transcriptional regulator